MNDIEWLKSNGFKRDTKCKEARMSSSGECWKRGFYIYSVNYNRLKHKRYYLVVFQYNNSWLVDFGKTAHWYGCQESTSLRKAIEFAFEGFLNWRQDKIVELSDERIAAIGCKNQLFTEGNK